MFTIIASDAVTCSAQLICAARLCRAAHLRVSHYYSALHREPFVERCTCRAEGAPATSAVCGTCDDFALYSRPHAALTVQMRCAVVHEEGAGDARGGARRGIGVGLARQRSPAAAPPGLPLPAAVLAAASGQAVPVTPSLRGLCLTGNIPGLGFPTCRLDFPYFPSPPPQDKRSGSYHLYGGFA